MQCCIRVYKSDSQQHLPIMRLISSTQAAQGRRRAMTLSKVQAFWRDDSHQLPANCTSVSHASVSESTAALRTHSVMWAAIIEQHMTNDFKKDCLDAAHCFCMHLAAMQKFTSKQRFAVEQLHKRESMVRMWIIVLCRSN